MEFSLRISIIVKWSIEFIFSNAAGMLENDPFKIYGIKADTRPFSID